MSHEAGGGNDQGVRWYDLFSRGSRDWLRHNEKVREAVRQALPDLIAGSDVISRPDNRTVEVPVHFLEHYRFRLRDPSEQQGAGQGEAQTGDVLRQAQQGPGSGEGGGGTGEGGLRFVLEFKIDDILDWLWEELQLPNLKPRTGDSLDEPELIREGWDKRGARSRLDRRRTVKEAVKRRTVQGESALPFTNDDLRFRQLTRRPRPTTNAVVIFVLDVSSSMDEHCRRLAKSFFFWALQGLRRQFSRIETVFVAHTIHAWEFSEEEFFQVRGEGGTKASTGLQQALEILEARYDSNRYNSYLFYASDGENFADDRAPCQQLLQALGPRLSFFGYTEVSHRAPARLATEMARLMRKHAESGAPAATYFISRDEDVWPAIRTFFQEQAAEAEES
jgi:sporulation protein YhbH